MTEFHHNFASGALAQVCSSRALAFRENVRGRTCWLAVSMKSRKFSKQMIEDYLDFCKEHGLRAMMTIVDFPYAFNAIAKTSSFEELLVDVEGLRKVRDESHRRLLKIMRKAKGQCEYVSWRDLVAETPEVFSEEIFRAMNERQEFREGVFKVAADALTEKEFTHNRSAYSQFFLSELPTLLYMYASFRRGVIDFYPGSNPALIWDILADKYNDLMPSISDAIGSSDGFFFVEYRASL